MLLEKNQKTLTFAPHTQTHTQTHTHFRDVAQHG